MADPEKQQMSAFPLKDDPVVADLLAERGARGANETFGKGERVGRCKKMLKLSEHTALEFGWEFQKLRSACLVKVYAITAGRLCASRR